MEESFLDLVEWVVLQTLDVCGGQPIRGKVLFQKIVFLGLQDYPKLLERMNFQKHILGPYSFAMDTAERELEVRTLLDKSKNEFSISSEGHDVVEQYAQKFCENPAYVREFREALAGIKADFGEFRRDEILAFVYKKFPRYTENSVEAENLDYEAIFVRMYREGKVGVKLVTELLGTGIEDVYDLIKKHQYHIIMV